MYCVSLVLLSSGSALPQDSGVPTLQQIRSATIADLRGLPESMDGGALWLSLVTGPPPAPAGAVSAERLRHRPSRAARAAYEKAGRLAREGAAEKAVKELEHAIALDREFAEAHCDLGAAYARLGRYPEAEAELRRAVDLIPEESAPRYNLALLLFAIGQRSEAEANLRRVLQLSPSNAKAHLLIGGLLVDSEQTRAEGLRHLEFAARTLSEANRMIQELRQ
jgi:Flp pilus assembly protein TadD